MTVLGVRLRLRSGGAFLGMLIGIWSMCLPVCQAPLVVILCQDSKDVVGGKGVTAGSRCT